MNLPLLLASNCRKETPKATKNTEPSAIDNTAHDVLNQLSVISLCCCELRNSMAEKLEADQLKELKRIEIAIQSAAGKIRQLKSLVRDYLPSHEDRIRP